MPKISNYVNQSLGPRRSAYIRTVDPKTRKIEAQLKDGGLIQIALFDIPSFFVWPKAGEHWIVRQDAGYWKLFNKFDSEDNQKVVSLKPGEAKIAAEVIKTPSGKSVVTAADSDYEWTNLNLINNWQDVSTLTSGDAGWTYANQTTDENYLLDLPPVSYQYDIFRKAVYLRGMIYHPSVANVEFSILEKYKPKQSIIAFNGVIVLKTTGALALSNSNTSGQKLILLNGLSIQVN